MNGRGGLRKRKTGRKKINRCNASYSKSRGDILGTCFTGYRPEPDAGGGENEVTVRAVVGNGGASDGGNCLGRMYF